MVRAIVAPKEKYMILSRLFNRTSMLEGPARELYEKIIHQSRQPGFYLTLGVQDTVEGRFDMISIHAFLVMHRLKDEGEDAKEFSQKLYDLMFADMEINLREMGIGDMGMGKRVKKLVKGFYGRLSAYEKGLATTDDKEETLKQALRRNLYREVDQIITEEALDWMAHYLRRENKNMADTPLAKVMTGEIAFGPAPEVKGDGV